MALTAPLTLSRSLTVSPAGWDLRGRTLAPLLVFSDIVEQNPLVRGSRELLPRTSGRRLVTRSFYSPSCGFPESFSFSFCFAGRNLPVLLLSAGLSELASDGKFPNAESFFLPWARCHSQPITYQSDSAAEKPLSKGNKKPWEQGLFVHGRGAAHDMWICQMLPLWFLLKHALTTAALSAWKELGDERRFYWQGCDGLSRQPGSSSLTQHHNSLQLCRLLDFVEFCPLFHLTVSSLHAYSDWDCFPENYTVFQRVHIGPWLFVQLSWCLKACFNALLKVSCVCLIGNIPGN